MTRKCTIELHSDGVITHGSKRFRGWIEADREALAAHLFNLAWQYHCDVNVPSTPAEAREIESIEQALRRGVKITKPPKAERKTKAAIRDDSPEFKAIRDTLGNISLEDI